MQIYGDFFSGVASRHAEPNAVSHIQTSWLCTTFLILVTFLNLALIYDIMVMYYFSYFSNFSKFSPYIWHHGHVLLFLF